MDDFNSIVLEGNVVRDPDSRETPKGTPVCMFSIAVNKNYRTLQGERKQEVSFFEVETWGNLASNCARYCTKGRGIRVVGRLKQNRWKDTEGKNHTQVRIVAEHVDFKPRFSPQRNQNKDPLATQKTHQEMADLAEAALANSMSVNEHQLEACEAVF